MTSATATTQHAASTMNRSLEYGRTRSRQPKGESHLNQSEPLPSVTSSAATRTLKAAVSTSMDRLRAWPT